MSRFKQNDRVVDGYLGAGEIFSVIYSSSPKKLFGYSVLFDKTPDKRYNGGENPCLAFPDNLIKEKSNKLEQLQKDVADAEVAHHGAEATRYSASINARCDARQTKDDARRALSKANKALRGYLKGAWDAV